jgi:RNase P/RNase MRP subunit p29
VADEPTIGEVVRILADLRRSFDGLAGKVLTVEVWKAERESMEFRIRETEKDIATLEAKAQADRDKREQEKTAADIRAASARRQVLLAVVTSFVFPVLVAIVLAATLKG